MYLAENLVRDVFLELGLHPEEVDLLLQEAVVWPKSLEVDARTNGVLSPLRLVYVLGLWRDVEV